MQNKVTDVFNSGADLLVGGLVGVGIYSAFSHAATGRELVGAAILTAAMAAVVGSRLLNHKTQREIDEIWRNRAPR